MHKALCQRRKTWNRRPTLTKKPTTRQPISKTRQQRLEDLKNLFVQKKENIARIVYEPGKIFQIFKEKEKVNIMVRNFNVNKSIIIFKINIVKPAIKYPRLIKSFILLNFQKTYFKDDLEETYKEFTSAIK